MAISRRRFLKSTAITAGAAALPLGIGNNAFGANDRIRVAVIGVHGQGRSHIRGFKDNLVALCDCDAEVLARRAQEFEKNGGRKLDTYQDYRKLLERDDIDVVSIATPNHSHSLIAIEACQAGKDVYVEKPVSHNVWEGRQLVNAARKYGRIVQTGTQCRSSRSLHEAHTFLHDGNLGAIQHAVGTCYKPRKGIGRLKKPLQIPDYIDYELWCGPAAKVDLYRPKLHYDWHWDFNTGNGDMGNQGIHQMDVARWFLGEAELSPRILSIGGRLGYDDAADTPNTQTVLHDYEKAPLIFETRGLPKADRDWKTGMDHYRGSRIGVIIQCEQGYIVIPSYTSAAAFDNDGNEIKKWQGGGNHYANCLQAVRSRQTSDLNADVLEGHLSSALCHTGALSHQLGRKAPATEIAKEIQSDERFADSFQRMATHLEANEIDIESSTITFGAALEMDGIAERFPNNQQANAMLTREYRKSFVVPDLST